MNKELIPLIYFAVSNRYVWQYIDMSFNIPNVSITEIHGVECYVLWISNGLLTRMDDQSVFRTYGIFYLYFIIRFFRMDGYLLCVVFQWFYEINVNTWVYGWLSGRGISFLCYVLIPVWNSYLFGIHMVVPSLGLCVWQMHVSKSTIHEKSLSKSLPKEK